MRLTEATVCSDSILSDVLEELNNINQYFRVLFYAMPYNRAKWMTSLWKIQKNFQKIFFILGVGGKKAPPLGILGFLRHFGQETVAAQKVWI